jgi:biuret amidohydrolase
MPIVTVDRIDPSRTAMLVVDMQNDFVAEGAPLEAPAARAMVPRLRAAVDACREAGIKVVYTAHEHRRDGSDIGLFSGTPAIANGDALVAGTPGADIYPALRPRPDEPIIRKRRFSAFFASDLDLLLRSWRIETVIIGGTTTENCCFSTARDALFRDYQVVFLSDATATFDYPDLGFGAMAADDVHRAMLVIIARSTGHVMSVDEMMSRIGVAAAGDPRIPLRSP